MKSKISVNLNATKTNILFAIPRPHHRLGGIDLAIDGISSWMAKDADIKKREDHHEMGSFDMVHFHGLWQPNHIRLYRHCLKNRVPYVVSPHGMLEPWAFKNRRWKKLPYYWLLERQHLSRANAVIATSEMEKQNILSLIPTAHVKVVPLGLDSNLGPDYQASREQLGIRTDQKVLLYLSRIDRKKSLDVAVGALTDFNDPHVVLMIVGEGDRAYENEIRNHVIRHRQSLPEIRWIGPVWGVDRWQYLQAADAMVLPTKSENFGFAVLEALWVGTPVVTTTATPWKDYPPECGVYICDSDVGAVRAKLIDVCSTLPIDSAWREKISTQCKSRFHWNCLQPEYQTTYQQALKNGQPD